MEAPSAEPAPTVAASVEHVQTWAERLLDYGARMLAQYGLRVLGALVVLVVSYFVANWTKRLVLAALDKAKFDPTISKFASNAARYAVLVLGLISCAPILGINVTAFAAVIGSLGLAVGLASQGALSNGAAGLMLLIMRPFKAGDAIVVDGVSGIVEEIELFATTLNTPDNRRIFMPNNSIFGKIVENSSANPHRATTFFTVVAANSDVDKVRATLVEACAACPSVVQDPPPKALLIDMPDGGLKWSITVWFETANLDQARDEAIEAVRDAMAKNGIAGPTPVTTIRMLDRPA
jgi:small conductance mechanosensitive channel